MMNLLDDPWIPVQFGGPTVEVSGRDALLRAHEIAQLAVDIPTMEPVILRQFLIPLVLDALGAPRSPAEWRRDFADGTFLHDLHKRDAERHGRLIDYFDRYHDRFELFHPQHPFAQVAGLRTARDDTKSTSLLIPNIASGNNVPLFSNQLGDTPNPLRPAEAARWLLHTHCWDTAAIKTGAADDPQAKGNKTSGNPTGPLGQLGVVIPIGRTLAETLMLNLPIVPDGLPDTDKPQWRRPAWTSAWEPRIAEGRMDLLTWQSRRVRLHAEDTEDGPRVVSVVVCAGDRLIAPPTVEPHTLWNANPKPKAGDPAWRPRRHMSGRASWWGLDAMLAVGTNNTKVQTSRQLDNLASVLDESYPLQIHTVGVEYGNQSAVIENIMSDALALPVRSLRDIAVRDAVLEMTQKADDLIKAANLLSADLRLTTSSDPLPWDKGQRPGDRVLHSLDPAVRLALAALQRRSDPDAVEQVLSAWEQLAWRGVQTVAEPLLNAISPRQFTGRRIEVRGREVLLCAPKAEMTFRRRVKDALPRAAQLIAARSTTPEA